MKVALIGATGFVGTALLKELNDRGHEVTAISRHPEKTAAKGPCIHPRAGDVLDSRRVADLVKGCDAVISAYNPGHYRSGLDNPVFDGDGQSVLSVEDLAMAVVDELEQPSHIRKRFTAAY